MHFDGNAVVGRRLPCPPAISRSDVKFLNGPCEPEHDCHLVTEVPYAGNFWKGNTSSDQYLGWWYGISHAYDLLLDQPADEPVRRRIRQAVKRVIGTLRQEDYLIVDPDGTVSTAGPEIVGNEALAFHLGHMAQHLLLRTETSPLLLDYHRSLHRERLYAPIAET